MSPLSSRMGERVRVRGSSEAAMVRACPKTNVAFCFFDLWDGRSTLRPYGASRSPDTGTVILGRSLTSYQIPRPKLVPPHALSCASLHFLLLPRPRPFSARLPSGETPRVC